MKFFRDSKKKSRSPASNHQIRLHALRLTKFFENIKEFLSLLDDGEEKSNGEYILDFQYVSSLVEKILARMNMIVHDACILVPEGGENLYLQLDSSTRIAKKRFIEANKEHIASFEPSKEKSSLPNEPEYILLRQVLDWMNEEGSESAPSYMQLLHNVLNYVFQQKLFKDIPSELLPCTEINSADAKNIVSIVDLEDLPDKDVSESTTAMDTLTNRPFGFMTLGVDHEGRQQDAEVRRIKRWLAVMDFDSLNMILTEPDVGLLLTVNLSGDSDSDFIFVLCGGKIPAKELLPSGFRIENTKFGSIACKYDASTKEMDDCLALLGSFLFGMSGNESLN